MELNEKIFDLKLKGYCCSQIITALGLAQMEKENDDLIAAMGAFCVGLEEGKLCGTLAAAAALLFVADARAAGAELRAELMDWFYDRFGGYDCDDILQGNEMNKIAVCPGMITETYEKLCELLAWEQ
ncbi:MAG: C-GCAxxG-C-C family protein [Clostridiales Family XIII bacterium]|jgi:hypothetical protein|nr:C-GCAxxG-C-C family protein [Clostridiales Family XIII bacterium]